MTLQLTDFVTETEGVELEDFPPEVQNRINGALTDLTSGGPGNGEPTDPPQSVVVDEGDSGDYSSIQDAIDEEGDSIDVIFVEPGEYEEDITVNISDVTLTSTEGSDNTTIDGSIFIEAAPTVINDVTIDGFTIESGSDPAIEAETGAEGDSQSGLEIVNNELVFGDIGAFLGQINNAIISSNTFTDNGSTAKEFLYVGGRRTYGATRPSENVTIENNTFDGAASRPSQPSGGNAIEFEATGSIANNDFADFDNESGTKVLIGPSSELSATEVAGDNDGLSEGAVEALLPPETPGSEFVRPGANEFGGEIQVTTNTLGGDEYLHITSGGESVADAATSGVWFNYSKAPVLGDFTGESPVTLSHEYYEGPNNEEAAPDEIYLLVEDTSGEYHVLYHTANDDFTRDNSEPPADETWLIRNVNSEISGDPDPEYNPNYNWKKFTEEGTEALGSDSLQNLAEVYDAEAELHAVAVSRGSTSGTTADVYFRNLELGGTQYSLESN